MKIVVRSVGKTRDKRLKQLCEEYLKRSNHYLSVVAEEVREGSGRIEEIKAQEAANLTQGVSPDSILISMDERGEEMTSEAFSKFIETHMIHGTRYIYFMIGGAAGLDPELMEQSQKRLSLSKMTLPHEMARTILFEQIYRAFTIIRGEPYHKD